MSDTLYRAILSDRFDPSRVAYRGRWTDDESNALDRAYAKKRKASLGLDYQVVIQTRDNTRKEQ